MAGPGQQLINAHAPVAALSEIISPLRLGTYLNAAGHDAQRALQIYLWNAKIGEAFHIPIQAVEVGLRNRVSDGLAAAFGPDWWSDPAFLALIGAKRAADIDVVKARLASKGKQVATGQIIAGLSFGFWVAMLHRRFNPAIWSGNLRAAFPHLPAATNLHSLHEKAGDIADFRNRIWHHEPIFRRNLTADYSQCMMVLGWLCPSKRTWIKPHCRVSTVMRKKP